MKTSRVVTAIVAFVVLMSVSPPAVFGDDNAEEIKYLKAENASLRAVMAKKDKELWALRAENEKLHERVKVLLRLKAINDASAAKTKVATAHKLVAETQPIAVPPAAKKSVLKDKWAGFRGIKWGTNIATVSGMKLVKTTGDCKFYDREGDKLAIGVAKLSILRYGFYKKRFFSVTMSVTGDADWIGLLHAVSATYGKGCQPNKYKDVYLWGEPFTKDHKDFKMYLEYYSGTKKALLIIDYKPIDDEKEADAARKDF